MVVGSGSILQGHSIESYIACARLRITCQVLDTLPHRFRDRALCELALTHSSAGEATDYERLEFLGDAVLELVVTEELYRCHPDLAEGVLTEMRAWVVSQRPLAEAAGKLELEAHVRVGSGMRGRAIPRSVLADLYESLVGAVYLDAGLEAAREFVHTTLAESLEEVRTRVNEVNPKQELQHRAQLSTGVPPDYLLIHQRGKAHARAFLIAAELGGRQFPSAWGRTRKEAERWAAHEALLVLEEEQEQGSRRG